MSTLRTSFISLALLLASFSSAQQSDGIRVIQGATVIPATGRPPIRNAVIVIESGRITAIGPRAEIRMPRGAEVVNASGKWIIPGLIDASVHFSRSGGLYTRPDVLDLRKWRPYEEEINWIKQRLPFTFERYLASGITSVVDCGGPMWNFEVRDLASKTRLAPRVAVGGPMIVANVPAALETADPPGIKVNSPMEAREVVRRQLDRTPDLVGISLTSNDPPQQREIISAAIDESKSHGIRVAVYATELDAAKTAVSAGADILVHSVTDRLIDTNFIDLVKNSNVLYMTGLAVRDSYRRVLNQEGTLSDFEKRLGDPEVIATWSDLAEISLDEVPGGISSQPRVARPVAYDNLALLDSAGVRIVAVTDAGDIGTLHGPSLHRELELMAAAGMRPAEIIVSATRNAAAVMGREKDLGTLETGKLADLVILDANPLTDITNTQKIFKVMKAGEFVP